MDSTFYSYIFGVFENLVKYGTSFWNFLSKPVSDFIGSYDYGITTPLALNVAKIFGNVTLLEVILGTGLSIVLALKLVKLILDAIPVV